MMRALPALACFFAATDCLGRIVGGHAAPLLVMPPWAEALGAFGWLGIAIFVLVRGTG